MKGIHLIREQLHSKVLRLRSVETLLSTILFERLWQDSDDKERKAVSKCIDDGDRKGITDWMNGHASLDVAERPFKYLKGLARKLRIRNYSRLSKVELIRAIKETEDGAK